MIETAQLASRGKRLGGAIVDSLIMAAVIIPIVIALGLLETQAAAGQASFRMQLDLGQALVVAAVGIGVFLVLNGYFLATSGQTIAKKLLGMRIVDANKAVPPFPRLFTLRYVVFYLVNAIPLVGNLIGLVNVLFIFGAEKRCLHDHLAGTWVIDVAKS